MTQRVVLIDDHVLMRAGLRELIEAQDGYTVVAEGSDGDQALTLVETHAADLLIMDISMPRMSGLEALKRIRQQWSTLPVIILSMHATRDFVMSAIRNGASAYLIKEAAEAELALALNAVTRGEQYLSPKISTQVISSALFNDDNGREGGRALTARQSEVLRYLALGKATKEIAFELGLSAKTVDTYRAQIMDRLGIHDVAGLVVYAIRQGIIGLDEYPF